MWGEIFTAIALVLVIEGVLPAISPVQTRVLVMWMLKQPDRFIRAYGFICLLLGAIIMLCVHWII